MAAAKAEAAKAKADEVAAAAIKVGYLTKYYAILIMDIRDTAIQPSIINYGIQMCRGQLLVLATLHSQWRPTPLCHFQGWEWRRHRR